MLYELQYFGRTLYYCDVRLHYYFDFFLINQLLPLMSHINTSDFKYQYTRQCCVRQIFLQLRLRLQYSQRILHSTICPALYFHLDKHFCALKNNRRRNTGQWKTKRIGQLQQ